MYNKFKSNKNNKLVLFKQLFYEQMNNEAFFLKVQSYVFYLGMC